MPPPERSRPVSDTNPMPSAQLLAKADALADAAWDYPRGTDEKRNDALDVALSAYRAARAASPVTLEEFLIVQEEDAQWCRTTVEWIEAVEMTHKHALVLIDARDNARRLAGEGGA